MVEGSPVAGRTGYPCGAPSCRYPACPRPGPSGSAPLTGTGIAPVRTQGREAAPPVAGARRFGEVYFLRLRGVRGLGAAGAAVPVTPGPSGAAVIRGRRCPPAAAAAAVG